jgi:hypothetical protein
MNIIKHMVEHNPTYTEDISVLAFDYSGLDIEEDELTILKSLVEAFCKERKQTYLEANIDELIEMDYVEVLELQNGTLLPSGFTDGALLKMNTITCDDSKIVTSMSIWRGSLSSSGSTYTATYSNDAWVVTQDGMWIS